MERLKLTKQEIAEILCIKKDSIRVIENRNKLEEKLKEKGYILIDKSKSGRSFIYEVDHYSQDKESLNNCIEGIFNTSNNDDVKSKYIMYRILNLDKPITKKYISELCNVSNKTISRWDDKMISNELLSKDGCFYIAMDFIDKDTANYRLTGKEEYNSFTKNNKIIKEREEHMKLWKENKINDVTFQIYMDGSVDSLKANYGKIVYRVSKFTLGENKELLKLVMDLIKKYYKYEIKDYYQDWLESIPKEKRADYYINEI